VPRSSQEIQHDMLMPAPTQWSGSANWANNAQIKKSTKATPQTARAILLTPVSFMRAMVS
jgi:hypothetical protein